MNKLSEAQLDEIIEKSLNEILPNTTIIDAIKSRYLKINEKIEEIITSEENCLNSFNISDIESEISIFDNELLFCQEAIAMHSNLRNKCIQVLELIEKNSTRLEEHLSRQQNDRINSLNERDDFNLPYLPRITLFQSGDRNFDSRNRYYINIPIIATKSGDQSFDEENQSFAEEFIPQNMQNR